MRKTLLALAVLGVFASAASAQTNVTIYGVVDAAIARVDNGTATTTRLDSGKQSASRLGFRGKEDLGGGLAAIFTLENGFSIDDGVAAQGGRLFGRQAWVGLSGSMGTFKAGRQWTPVYANLDTFDPFGNNLAGNSERIFTTEFEGGRFDNNLTYNFSANGFRGELQYAFGEVAGNTSASRSVGGFAGYRNGPLDAVVTYTKVNNATATDDRRTWLVGGNYDLGVVKPYVAYASVKGFGTVDNRDWLVGLTAPVGKTGTLMASYVKRNNRATANADANQWALGYAYALSKRTNVYTSYGRISNDANSALGVGGTGGTPLAGNNASEFNVGVRHKF